MTARPEQPSPQARLVELVTEAQLAEPGPEVVAELEALMESPRARRLYLELISIQGHLETLHAQRGDDASKERLSAAEILDVLREAEDAAPDYYVASLDHSALPAPVQSDDRPALTMRRVTSAAMYFLGQQVTPRRTAVAGIAAVVLLGLTIFLAMQGQSPSSHSEPVPFTNTPTDTDVQASPRPVATLTAAHDARWQSDIDFGTPEPGKALLSGQRLVLTQGFAEITTNRGAVVLIQAPATIEMLASDNAVYLHEGKLVGACRTAASKGFLVATRHADIVDVGTEFGAEVSDQGVTATVFTGSVEVTPAGGSTETFVANQTARLMVYNNARELQVESRVAEGFTRLLPRAALVAAATINDDRFRVEVVPQGVVEDAKLFTDREHEINGLDREGIPAELLGGDLIRMPADARPNFHKNTENLSITLELSAPAEVYLLFGEPDQPLPGWIKAQYEPTGLRVGMDFGQLPKLGEQPSLGVGPGVSIDQELQVWKRKQVATGRVLAGGPLQNNFTYSLIAVPAPQHD